jgi:hypothetical protein
MTKTASLIYVKEAGGSEAGKEGDYYLYISFWGSRKLKRGWGGRGGGGGGSTQHYTQTY